jgi:hydrogenase-4 membrane subunit HyfE
MFTVAASLAAREITRMTAFGTLRLRASRSTRSITSMMIVVVLHHSLLAHGSAITLCGAVFAPGSPSAIEITDTFDAVIAAVVTLAIARALISFDPQLDIRSLRELRG